jgi:Tol biopolymer transport system component/serine/threonine protein kinase
MRSHLIGETLGQYHILEELGRGGMAVVYKAYQPALERYVAVKVLPRELTFDDEFVERFLREARAAARLNHSNIVTIHDVGQVDGTYFIVMEYLDGASLTGLLNRQAPLTPQRATQIVSQVALALDYAHQQGFVHRDIKPGNILLDAQGVPKLTDFGIVKAAEGTRLTQTGTLLGTPEYMSPEQARGLGVERRTDIYSLGVVAYEMLSGRVPFSGDTMAVLHAHAYEQPDLSVLPRGVQDVVGKALAKDPRRRYGSGEAFARALEQTLAGRSTGPRPRPGPGPLSQVPTWLWGIGAAAVVLGLAFAFFRPPTPAAIPTPARTTAAETPVKDTPSPVIEETAVSTTAAPTPRPTAPATPAPTALPNPIGKLAFDSQRDGHWEVCTMNADGSGLVNLTNHPAEDGDPSWSPDGQRIAFDTDRDGNWEIYAMNAEGSGATRLTNHPADDDHPAWSPDGRHIAFKSNRDENWEIYVVNVADLSVTNLTRHPAADRTPAWSPDGQHIAFASERDGDWDVYLMNADGSGVTQLTHHQAEDWFPAWSPDGRRIAFHSYRDGNAEIYVMNADGTGLGRLTHNVADDWGPDWSRDSEWIAFASDRDGDNEIYVMRSDGTDVRRLTHNEASDTWPVWQPSVPAGGGGVEACPLQAGMVVQTTENARLWSQPDVTAATTASELDAGVSLAVLTGPSWGRVRLDIDYSGWWWQVAADGAQGWIWQSRIAECTSEESSLPSECPAPNRAFAAAWNEVHDRIGCASGPGIQGLVAEENFEGGKMFWREPIDTAQALVLFSDGSWQLFPHAPYEESMPEFSCADADTPAQCPPTPKRGFGTMWCDIPEIRDRLGNATDCERGYQGWMQQFERGFMLKSDDAAIYAFYDDGRWERE